MAGEHLEQAHIVCVELVEPELRENEHADDVRAVAERHGQQRLLDSRRALDVVSDPAVGGVAGQKRLPRRGHVTGDADPDLRHEHVEGRLGALRQVTPKRHRPKVVSVTEEDPTVVVVDQLPELFGDRGADLAHLEQAREPARDTVQHLQVRDRADLVASRSR